MGSMVGGALSILEGKLDKGDGVVEFVIDAEGEALQIEIRVLANQFDVEGIEGADRFGAIEREHLKVVTDSRNLQRKMRGIGRPEHTLIL